MLSLTGNAELKIHVPKNFSVGEVINGSCVASKKDFEHVRVLISITISDDNECTLDDSKELKTSKTHFIKDFSITCNTKGSHHIKCHTSGKNQDDRKIKFEGI